MGEREDLIDSIWTRIEHVLVGGDPAVLLEGDAFTAVTRLLTLAGGAARDAEAAQIAGWFHWLRFQLLPEGADQADLGSAMALLALVYETSPEAVPPDLRAAFDEHGVSWPDRPEDAHVWHEEAAAAYEEHLRTGEFAALERAVTFIRRSLAATPPGHPGRAMVLTDLMNVLRTLFVETGDPATLSEAVTLGREAARVTPAGDPGRAPCLTTLASALRVVFESGGDPAALDESVEVGREAVASFRPGDPGRPSAMADLADGLRILFERDGTVAALEEAARLGREAVAATPPGHPERHHTLFCLTNVLRRLFTLDTDLAPLDESIAAGREALASLAPGDLNRPMVQSNTADGLRLRYEVTGDVAALREAVELGRESVAGTPPGHHYFAEMRGNLALALQRLFDRTGEVAALEESIRLGREALTSDAARPHLPQMRSNLANALRLLYERTGDPVALEQAIEAGRQTLAITPSGQVRLMALTNLGVALQLLYQRTGEVTALEDAVGHGREAVASSAPGDHLRPTLLSNLSNGLRIMYERTGDPATLDEAVAVSRAAAGATPPGHASRALFLSNLGTALHAAFDRTGEPASLSEAIDVLREAVRAAPPGDPRRAVALANLGNALHAHFERSRDPEVLAEAVAVWRESLLAVPESGVGRARYLSNLALSLRDLSEQTGDAAALTEAVELLREAIAVTPDGSPDRALYLSNFGIVLRDLAERTGAPADRREAITTARAAVAATPALHPQRAAYQYNLGMTLWTSFQLTEEAALLGEAGDVFAEAAEAETATPLVRLSAFTRLGDTAMTAGRAVAALDAYEKAIALLPQVTPRRLDRAAREHGLGRVRGLPGAAAAAAITAGRPERAVELLEQARGVLIGETMAAHGDLTELRGLAPGLAERFERLRDELDATDRTDLARLAPVQEVPSSPDGGAWRSPAEQAAHVAARDLVARRGRLAKEWDGLLAEISRIGGLEGFMLPPPIDVLRRQAAHGPIVLVNSSPFRCDALIVTDDPGRPVRLVELPGVSGGVIEQVNRFLGALAAITARGPERLAGQRVIRETLGWLWDHVAGPVLAELRSGGLVRDGRETRLWWCPVGEMTILPLHAAGHHGASKPAAAPRTVMDMVVSSYTPTIRALGFLRDRAAGGDHPPATATSGGGSPRALIVALPATPDAAPLPGARAEARLLARLLPGSLTLTGVRATHDAVLAALPGCPIAHLACHGVTDWRVPAAGRLLLHDHTTRPLTVTAISRLRLAHAELAYLSACDTTRGNQNLADEAVHITAAFQLAGFRNVVGTLWSINDLIAVRIAEQVYDDLTGGGTTPPRTAGTARALHRALLRLRAEHPDDPALWAAHIHAGV
ncbi:CHAT domain-containing protein [Sphaerisporangium siamense]|uniref:Tetratricopeptide (TPR) repeat protein n=1 Tax=Sphaerisporangium siamense TaxID=795645 RepID=A0A7W7D7E3_9ACTN|nr:CHAT domain-containing protein [Sphaerisporangium siamense]MBB4700730.1 tetratricopeptide (TPR) repeat protein [Sphaerisporangium siamense]GII88779.1 CHAT domain-containing protein [Sphaerisporangium siamense]